MSCPDAPDMENTPDTRPRLPLDLEREIFEIVAFQRPIRKFSGLLNLMLVARRVHEWIKPFLYSVMVKSRTPYAHNYPPSHHRSVSDNLPVPLYPLYGDHIRHLMLQNLATDEFMQILRCCPNAQNVGISMIRIPYDEFRTIVSTMHIRRLSVDVDELFHNPYITDGRQFFVDHTIFTHLTHLEAISTRWFSWKDWQPITLIPTLSHLCIDRFNEELVEKTLQCSPALELFVLYLDEVDLVFIMLPEQDSDEWLSDRRLVLLRDPGLKGCLDDWEEGAHGLGGWWIIGQLQKERKLPLQKQHLLLLSSRARELSDSSDV